MKSALRCAVVLCITHEPKPRTAEHIRKPVIIGLMYETLPPRKIIAAPKCSSSQRGGCTHYIVKRLDVLEIVPRVATGRISHADDRLISLISCLYHR
jgi:hypothetical protein